MWQNPFNIWGTLHMESQEFTERISQTTYDLNSTVYYKFHHTPRLHPGHKWHSRIIDGPRMNSCNGSILIGRRIKQYLLIFMTNKKSQKLLDTCNQTRKATRVLNINNVNLTDYSRNPTKKYNINVKPSQNQGVSPKLALM